MLKKNLWNIVFILSIFLFDRISKILVLNKVKTVGELNYSVNSFLNLNLIWNDGIAFGLLSFDQNFYYNFLTLIIILVTLIIFWMIIKTQKLEKVSFMMIFGGSLGNIFDRLYYSAVPDFIDLHINNFHWFIFNVADIFITVGVVCMVILETINNNKQQNE